jgi:hypothetical protein
MKYNLSPKPFKSGRIGCGVSNGVLDVAVAEVVLDEAGVRALVGQRKTAGVTQHVRVSVERQSGPLAVGTDREPSGPAVQRGAPVADKQGSALGLQSGSFDQPRFYGSQLIAAQRMRGRESLLEPANVQHAAFKIHLGELEAARFRDAEAVAEHEQEKAAVADLVPAAARGGNEFFHLDRGEVFPVVHRFVQCLGPGNANFRRKTLAGYHDIGQKDAFCPMFSIAAERNRS